MATINPAKSLKETTFCTTLAWLLHFSCSNASLFLSSYIIGRFFDCCVISFSFLITWTGRFLYRKEASTFNMIYSKKTSPSFFLTRKQNKLLHYVASFITFVSFVFSSTDSLMYLWDGSHVQTPNPLAVDYPNSLSLCWIGYIFIETRPGWTTPKQTDAFDQ